MALTITVSYANKAFFCVYTKSKTTLNVCMMIPENVIETSCTERSFGGSISVALDPT